MSFRASLISASLGMVRSSWRVASSLQDSNPAKRRRVPVACWLLKTEPKEYSLEDLMRDGRAPWDGVKNPLALKHMKAMKPGDDLFIYHTGDVRAIVGTAKVASLPYPAAD